MELYLNADALGQGAQKRVPHFEVHPGGMRSLKGHHWERADIFDAMHRDAARRHGARNPDAPFTPPFTPGQIAMARHYGDLVERLAAGGLRCSSVEAGHGGTQGGAFMEAWLRAAQERARIEARIGSGVALSVRRQMDRGNHRISISITDAELVRRVVLGQQALSAVLDAFGWPPEGKSRKALRMALCGALDRMQGYGDA